MSTAIMKYVYRFFPNLQNFSSWRFGKKPKYSQILMSFCRWLNMLIDISSYIYIEGDRNTERMVIKHFVCTPGLHNRLQVPTTTRNSLDLLSYFRHPADVQDQKTSKSSHIIWCFIMGSHVFQIWKLPGNTYTSQIRPLNPFSISQTLLFCKIIST